MCQDHVWIHNLINSNMNHSHDANWFVKIMSGIITMIDSYMNHSYDAKWSVKIMSGIITMINNDMNHSHDANWSLKIMSGIITMIFTVISIMVMMLSDLLKSCLES